MATVARPHVGIAQTHQIHIAIGIGEIFEAIETLVITVARQQIPVGRALAAAVGAWLDCYLGQPAEPRLRELLAEMKIVGA